MAVLDSAKVDLLFKKAFGVTKTDLPTNKSPSNETIASPLLLRGDNIWTQASSIPATAAATLGIVQAYQTTSSVQCTADTTSVPISSVYPSWKTGLADWIPPEFGSTYFVKVYVDNSAAADPSSTGTQIFDSGSGGTGEWNFDYSAGVLNFIGGTIPAALTSSKVLYVAGYRYIGPKGLATITIGNLTTPNVTITSGNIQGVTYGQFSNLSSANAYITGGSVTGLTGAFTTLTATNFSSANVTSITGGAGTFVATNFSSGNVQITGGSVTGLTGAFTTLTATNFSSSNVNSISGSAGTLVITNFSTANAQITSGSISGAHSGNAALTYTTTTNFSTANAQITGGSLTGITGAATTFTATNFSSGNIVGVLTGTASTSNVALYESVTSTSTNANFYPKFTDRSITGNSAAYVNSSLTYNPSTGALVAPVFAGNISTNYVTSTGNLTLTSGGNLIVFNSTSAIKLPIGGTSLRPAGANGLIRFNTDSSSIEYWGGSSWVGLTNTVTDQQITGDGTNVTYTLDQSATDIGILVSINGTLQQPGIAYSVVGNQITFAEIPLTSDLIDIRFLGATVSVDTTVISPGSIAVGTTATIIDSWSTTISRSAKYTISSGNTYDSQIAEVMVIQQNGNVLVNTFGVLNTGGNSVTYSANISGSTVNLLATGTTSGNQLKLQKTYFSI